MVASFFTKEKQWLDKWDEFLFVSERGLYNQYSDWIKSYEVYGFDYDFLIITQNDEIVGGCGIVIAKFSFLKFYIIPSGPVLHVNHGDKLDSILEKLKENAINRGCCYFQISLPIVSDGKHFESYAISIIDSKSNYFNGQNGTKFKYVIPLYGMRLVDLRNKSYHNVVLNYSKNHKRNVLKSEKENLTFKFVDSKTEIERAYNCFVLNAKDKGYPLRSYDSMEHTLQSYISKGYAKMGSCFYKGQLVGAIYVMVCGQRLIYINGGVLKDFQNLSISHFMHDSLIKFSIEKGYKSYDVSVGGSSGVVNFKEGFGSELYTFIDTKHWVLKPSFFKIYLLFENNMKPYKSKIASILFTLKKIRR